MSVYYQVFNAQVQSSICIYNVMFPIRLDSVFNPCRKLTSKDNAAFIDIIIVCKSSHQAAVAILYRLVWIAKPQRERERERERERQRQRDRERQTDRELNSNSKTLFYKDCSLGLVKYLSNS